MINVFLGQPFQPPLRGLSLQLSAGQILLLAGRPGSGRHLVIGLAVGRHRPQRGIVKIDGVDVSSLSMRELDRWRRRHVSLDHRSSRRLWILDHPQDHRKRSVRRWFQEVQQRARLGSSMTLVRLPAALTAATWHPSRNYRVLSFPLHGGLS